MEALAALYEKPSASNKLYLMKKLFNLKMQQESRVADFLNEFQAVVQQLAAMDLRLDTEIQALLLLSCLPDTWELVKLPKGKKALHNRWIYRVKGEADGRSRYKARLVVKGYEQRAGVDYTDVFAPVVKLTTIRTVLSIVAVRDLHLEQMDMKTAFLHGDLEEIYMHQPVGFEERGKESLVCRLHKSCMARNKLHVSGT